MTITFSCPNQTCESHVQRKKLNAKDEQVGRELPCPACRIDITVPPKEVADWLKQTKLIQGNDVISLLRKHLAITRNQLNTAEWRKYLKLIQGGDFLSQVHLAIASKQLEALKWLLNHRPDINSIINATNANGETLLHFAAYGGDVEIMKCLKGKSAEIDARINNPGKPLDDDMPIHIVAGNGHFDAVKWLLKQDKNLVNARGYKGRTPMHQAATTGKIDVMRLLHECDKSVINDKCDEGYQSIHYAAMNDQTESLRCLVKELGTYVDVKVNRGTTPLHMAASLGKIASI